MQIRTADQSNKTKAPWLGTVVFCGLLAVMALTAIPYAAADPWWEAAFEVSVFALAVFSMIEVAINGSLGSIPLKVILPLLVLIAFAFIQTLSFGASGTLAGNQMWNAISADPFETRRWILKMLALIVFGVMLTRYTSDDRRLRVLTSVIILIGVASAFFGIFRQTIQKTDGFLFLSRLKPNSGYAQFINKNQFAFLAEMTLGLALGLLLGRGVKRETRLIYLAVSLPLWIAIALSASRGSLIAILSEALFLAVAVTMVKSAHSSKSSESFVMRVIETRFVRIAILVGLLASIFVGTIWIAGDRLTSRFETVELEMRTTENQTAGANRLDIWRATWALIRDHPIAGVGFGGFWAALPRYHQASGESMAFEAHNDYLEYVASSGLIGLAIGLWFLFMLASQARISWLTSTGWRRAAWLGAVTGIFGVLVHSLVDFGLHNISNASMFTALMTIIIGRERHRTLISPGRFF